MATRMQCPLCHKVITVPNITKVAAHKTDEEVGALNSEINSLTEDLKEHKDFIAKVAEEVRSNPKCKLGAAITTLFENSKFDGPGVGEDELYLDKMALEPNC